ncbi:hypothetical protein PZH35_09970 [Veillonella atypica]|nr:hypothetical protein [Veillonella atypica]MDE8714650.1 hypothetical protein [Veillonella atypica]
MLPILTHLCFVATVLTACGIETDEIDRLGQEGHTVATVLTACGIKT